jgi:hypothetical protein
MILFLLSTPMATTADEPVETGKAMLPLDEVLRLHRETEKAKRKPKKVPPPMHATIHRLDMSGRLLDGAIDLTASFEVVVLENGDWVSVPLLEHDGTMHLSSLPQIKDGYFAVEDGYLRFMTQHKGVYSFDVSLLKQAERSDQRRLVRLGYEHAALAICRVTFDEGLFHLRNDERLERSEGVLLFPEDNAFTIEWERLARAVEIKKRTAPPPAIESIVTRAHASAVSTLEGRHVIRVRYDLRFAGTESIEIEVPRGLTVERAYVNGVSAPVEMEDETLPIEVLPVREGDQSAVLELVLISTHGSYFLSGSFEVTLPRVTWPINELFLSVHLPQVFNYNWSGGSLSPVAEVPAVSYTYDVPVPGKSLAFHQHLISASAPNVTLDYAVDLEGHYYRP